MSEPAGTADFQGRRKRGIAAYAKIFAVPEEEVLAAFLGRVGPVSPRKRFRVRVDLRGRTRH